MKLTWSKSRIFFLIPRIGEYIWIKEKEAAVFQPKGEIHFYGVFFLPQGKALTTDLSQDTTN